MTTGSNNLQTLYKEFDSTARTVKDHFKDRLKKHQDIIDSLNPKFKIREYQREAIGRCIFYLEEYEGSRPPYHVLFNMATGSGKTLVMAASILYLYKKGYRNFIFFTHLSNIIEKTRENFLKPTSSKYLFSPEISIDDSKVSIKEVNNFEGGSDRDINIIFTTMAGLHNKWQNPRENGLSEDDLVDKKVVLLGDEAHHFSAQTKKLSREEKADNNNWENTILADQDEDFGNNYPGLLHVNQDGQNILLEFTATLDWGDAQITDKYHDKVICRYDLSEFRKDGYSKNVRALQFDTNYLNRCLAAIVVSQYKFKISERSMLKPRAIKPVILFKSNRVNKPDDETKTKGDNPTLVVSNEFKQLFHQEIQQLSAGKLNEIKKICMKSTNNKGNGEGAQIIKKAFKFFEAESISMENLAREIKRAFAPENCLSVDEGAEKELDRDKQLILNSLEDKNNNIRAIFATEKLNEGWDVLNLFDIVRLYDSRDSKDNEPGKTTIQEAQLIGRGARYCPFKLEEADDEYKRKFDADIDNPLAALEVLHYHCTHNPQYISEINKELERSGIGDGNGEKEKYTIEPKEDIPDIDVKVPWQKASVFLNQRIPRPMQKTKQAVKDAIKEWDESGLIFRLGSRGMVEETVGIESGKTTVESTDTPIKTKKIKKKASELGENVFRHALGTYPKANFDVLMKHFSDIKSTSDLIKSIISNVSEFTLEVTDDAALSQEEKLNIARKIVASLLDSIFKSKADYVGTKKYNGKMLGDIFGKTKTGQVNKEGREDYTKYGSKAIKRLVSQPWFAQTSFDNATDQEVAFLEFIDEYYEEIKKSYDYFLMFRNDNHFSIFNTDNDQNREEGETFNPDFLLVLRKKNSKRIITHQVFVEAKGPQFLGGKGKLTFKDGNQGWKEDFLLRIKNEAEIDVADKNIEVMGLPFFNKKIRSGENNERYDVFVEAFKNNLLRNSSDDKAASDSLDVKISRSPPK